MAGSHIGQDDGKPTEVWWGLTCCDGPDRKDDEVFLNKVIDFMTDLQQVSIDPDHIYATGVSAGGAMTNLMGCDVPRISAIAPISDEFNKNETSAAAGCKKVNVMEFRSTNDVFSCFYSPADNPTTDGNNANCRPLFQTADQTFDRLLSTNGCAPASPAFVAFGGDFAASVQSRSMSCGNYLTAQIKLQSGNHVPYGAFPVAEIMWDPDNGIFSMP